MIPYTEMFWVAMLFNLLMAGIIYLQYLRSVHPGSDEAIRILSHRGEDGSMEMRIYFKGIFLIRYRLAYLIGVNIFAWMSVLANMLTDAGTEAFGCMVYSYVGGCLIWIACEYTSYYYRLIARNMLIEKYLRNDQIKYTGNTDMEE